MHLTYSFVLLLGSLFTMTFDTYAIPLTRRQTGVVTLPLKRTPLRRDVHPQMLLQMHGLRAQRRLARMTGRTIPSAEELLDRRTVRVANINGRNPPRVGYAGAKLGSDNGPTAVSTASRPNVDATVFAANASGGDFVSIDEQAAENNTLTPANTPQTANSLGLAIQANNVGYVAIIQMGTPPREFNLLMDSGSADLWVGAEGCKSDDGNNCGDHVFLGSLSSTSFVDTQNPFNVTYGTGSVDGNVVQDNIVVAGLQLPNHTFGVAKRETVDFSSDQTHFDGIMGLAQSGLSEQQTLTPVESLAKAGLIQEAITSFKISRLADQKNDGEVTFGGLDASKFDQNTLVTMNNVNAQGFWEAQIDAVSANNTDLGLNGRTAILDTGTTLLVVPQQDAEAIHQSIPGAVANKDGTFTIPCTTNASVALTFGGRPFAIDPRDTVFAPVDPKNLTGDCISGIMAGQFGGQTQWLVGDVFLKNAYFSTNVGKNTIQLANLI